MANGTRSAEVEIRDTRLKSIMGFHGRASELQEYSRQLKKPEKDRCFTQCSDCAQMCAATVTNHIQGSAVVYHSPMGCFACTPAQNEATQNAAKARGIEPFNVRSVCSNISEKDTIYGGLKKLRDAINLANERFSPTCIFIQSSCAAGIVGDDIESVADEMAAELGIPIVPVFCEGFKSKAWSSGFDAGYHGILRKIVKKPEKKQEDLVNIFNFLGSDTFSPMLSRLGLRANYLVPLADIDALRSMSEAACSTQVCETLGTYVTTVLEEEFGVPKVHAPSPYGIGWTDAWYREIARITGKSGIVEELIEEEHKRIEPELKALREELKGLRVYIYAGDSYAHNLASLVTDLGVEIAGITTLHHDMRVDGDDPEYSTLQEMIDTAGDIEELTVCNKQPYEIIKQLKKVQPDFMIVRHMNMTILAGKLGIPCIFEGEINVSAGYDGLLLTGRRIRDLMKVKKLLGTLSEYNEFPYTDWWLEQEEHYI